MLAIDIETTALEPEDGEIRLIQLSDGKRVIVYDVRNKPNYTLTSLTGVDELAAHNAPFEARWLREKLGIEIPDLHDTLVMSGSYTAGRMRQITDGSGTAWRPWLSGSSG
jgi:ribonuclease D